MTGIVFFIAACGGGGGGSSSSTGSGSSGTGTGVSVSGSSGSGSSGSAAGPIAIAGMDAKRLAEQAAFGPTPDLVNAISAQGSAWIDGQIQTPSTGYAPIAPISASSQTVCPTGLSSTCYQIWR